MCSSYSLGPARELLAGSRRDDQAYGKVDWAPHAVDPRLHAKRSPTSDTAGLWSEPSICFPHAILSHTSRPLRPYRSCAAVPFPPSRRRARAESAGLSRRWLARPGGDGYARGVRPLALAVAIASALLLPALLPRPAAGGAAPAPDEKPWCAPEVVPLSDHVCFYEGGASASGRRTLVVYLHGMLATNPGFQYVQQRALANEAKALGFTVLFPTSPLVEGGYYWPTSRPAQEAQEPAILAGIEAARAALAARVGHPFDETFVVGFSSGAYYASSLVMRGALDVDGYIVLAGAASWARPRDAGVKRAPVFVGVSATDGQTADHSRAFAGTLAALRWPYRVEERHVGHLVDWGFMAHGIAWLRARTIAQAAQRGDGGAP
jgi:predicted esterase